MATTPTDLITNIRGKLDERGVSDAVYVDNDLLTWINHGITKTPISLKSLHKEDWFSRRMDSNDSSETIRGVTYAPSSFQLVDGTDLYTLPPDLLEIRSLEPLDQSDRDSGVQLIHRDLSTAFFRDVARRSSQEARIIYYWDLVGTSLSVTTVFHPQMLVVPVPAETIDLEMWYTRVPQFYGYLENILIVPEWTLWSVEEYVVFRALYSINHPDWKSAKGVSDLAFTDAASFASPRQSSDPTFVEGLFDDDDLIIPTASDSS